jgi:hypothetical protein
MENHQESETHLCQAAKTVCGSSEFNFGELGLFIIAIMLKDFTPNDIKPDEPDPYARCYQAKNVAIHRRAQVFLDRKRVQILCQSAISQPDHPDPATCLFRGVQRYYVARIVGEGMYFPVSTLFISCLAGSMETEAPDDLVWFDDYGEEFFAEFAEPQLEAIIDYLSVSREYSESDEIPNTECETVFEQPDVCVPPSEGPIFGPVSRAELEYVYDSSEVRKHPTLSSHLDVQPWLNKWFDWETETLRPVPFIRKGDHSAFNEAYGMIYNPNELQDAILPGLSEMKSFIDGSPYKFPFHCQVCFNLGRNLLSIDVKALDAPPTHELIDNFWKTYFKGYTYHIVCAPCGSGKTSFLSRDMGQYSPHHLSLVDLDSVLQTCFGWETIIRDNELRTLLFQTLFNNSVKKSVADITVAITTGVGIDVKGHWTGISLPIQDVVLNRFHRSALRDGTISVRTAYEASAWIRSYKDTQTVYGNFNDIE